MSEHKNEEFVDPIRVSKSEVFSGTTTWDYSLSHIEFNEIKRGSSEVLSLGKSLLLIWIGYALPLVPKFFQGGATALSPEQWKVLGGFFSVSFVIFVFGLMLPQVSMFLPTEKGKTLRKIQRFFDGNEPTKHAVKDYE